MRYNVNSFAIKLRLVSAGSNASLAGDNIGHWRYRTWYLNDIETGFDVQVCMQIRMQPVQPSPFLDRDLSRGR